jgi:hypothetical protein
MMMMLTRFHATPLVDTAPYEPVASKMTPWSSPRREAGQAV